MAIGIRLQSVFTGVRISPGAHETKIVFLRIIKNVETKEKIGCQTLVRIESDGTKVFKYKKKFETLDEAIEACKKLNSQPHRISKLVSYKCGSCCKYHTGSNGIQIKEKY